MGLYDTIHAKIKLPQPTDPKGFNGTTHFQTKDLECCLVDYQIREDGTLWRLDIEYTEAECKDRLFGIEPKSSNWVFDAITKTIEMYDFVHSNESEYDYWIDYKVVFIKGVIDNIEISKFEATPNAERKESDRIFRENLIKRQKFSKTKAYKYLYRPYSSIVYGVTNMLASIIYFATQTLNKTMVVIYKIRNKIVL